MTTPTMRAIRLHEHGGPDVLRYEQVPLPQPGPGEVLVRVHAVGVNPPDWYLRDGMSNLPENVRPKFSLPVIPGTDLSGVIEAVAADVDDFRVGDEVFGLLRFPGFDGSTYAQYVAAPASDLARKPAGIDHIHAAGAPMAGLTAWQFLIDLGHDHPSPFQAAQHRPVPLGAHTTVLINGAAGGVGHFALQLAKWKGARVIAVASGAHEAFLRELGADDVVDYRSEDFTRLGRYDLVLDLVAHRSVFPYWRALARGGRYLCVGGTVRTLLGVATVGAALGLLTGRRMGVLLVRQGPKHFTPAAERCRAGDLRIHIDRTFPLEEVPQALAYVGEGRARGKVVVTP